MSEKNNKQNKNNNRNNENNNNNNNNNQKITIDNLKNIVLFHSRIMRGYSS